MKYYNIKKVTNNETSDYGILDENDAKLVLKGYSFNGMFYSRKNVKNIFVIEEVDRNGNFIASSVGI